MQTAAPAWKIDSVTISTVKVSTQPHHEPKIRDIEKAQIPVIVSSFGFVELSLKGLFLKDVRKQYTEFTDNFKAVWKINGKESEVPLLNCECKSNFGMQIQCALEECVLTIWTTLPEDSSGTYDLSIKETRLIEGLVVVNSVERGMELLNLFWSSRPPSEFAEPISAAQFLRLLSPDLKIRLQSVRFGPTDNAGNDCIKRLTALGAPVIGYGGAVVFSIKSTQKIDLDWLQRGFRLLKISSSREQNLDPSKLLTREATILPGREVLFTVTWGEKGGFGPTNPSIYRLMLGWRTLAKLVVVKDCPSLYLTFEAMRCFDLWWMPFFSLPLEKIWSIKRREFERVPGNPNWGTKVTVTLKGLWPAAGTPERAKLREELKGMLSIEVQRSIPFSIAPTKLLKEPQVEANLLVLNWVWANFDYTKSRVTINKKASESHRG